jgi:predicted chitinase
MFVNPNPSNQKQELEAAKNRKKIETDPLLAAQIAIWYWNTRVKPKVQNFDDTVAVTKTINNAMFGLEDRLANFIDYKKRVA